MTHGLDGPNKLIHNEIQKLRANFCNGCGIAAAAAGFIVPLIKLLHTFEKWTDWIPALIFGSFGISVALICHSVARIYISKLKE